MPDFVLTAEFAEVLGDTADGGSSTMGKKKFGNAFHNKDRAVVTGLKNALNYVKKMDARRTAKAPAGTTPLLFKKKGATDHTTKIDALITRCDECLAAKIAATAKAVGSDEMF